MKNNLINLTDSYKFSHFNQYPEGTEYVHSYLESRGGIYDAIVVTGMQYYLKEFLAQKITQENLNETEELCKMHGVPFNKAGWQHIITFHGGRLPVVIRALPEGTVVRPKEVIMTIENTDPNCAWLTSFLETLLLKVWYPTTVASKARYVRKLIEAHHTKTMDDISGVPFAYHNFGDRGSSSVETAAIGGYAHLTQFMGTDNFNALTLCRDYYSEKMAGFSIVASEHSTVTSHAREKEYDMITKYLEDNKGQAIIACVLDSYDIYKAVDFVTSKLKAKIESENYPIFVIRPDSGDQIEVVGKILDIMEENGVATTINSKGYTMFNKYRIIWGDGVTPEAIDKILAYIATRGYAAGNMAFGSGGDIMQNVNRDTCKFAVKCSAVCINGVWKDVFKDPVTDQGKKSKKGRLTFVRWKTKGWADKKVSQHQTIRMDSFDPELHEDLMVEIFRDGVILNKTTLAEVRELSRNETFLKN